MMTIFKNSIQDGPKSCSSMTKIPSDEILESLYILRIRESEHLKTVLEWYDMEIHQKISMPNYQRLKTMVKRRKDPKLRLRSFDARHEKIETCAVVKESTGNHWRWRRNKYLLPVERKRPVFAKRPLQFPPQYPRSCTKKQITMPPHLLSHPYHVVEVCRGREVSEAIVTMGPFFDKRLDIMWRVPARERLVNIGIHPSANFIKQKRVVSQRHVFVSSLQGWWITK